MFDEDDQRPLSPLFSPFICLFLILKHAVGDTSITRVSSWLLCQNPTRMKELALQACQYFDKGKVYREEQEFETPMGAVTK